MKKILSFILVFMLALGSITLIFAQEEDALLLRKEAPFY